MRGSSAPIYWPTTRIRRQGKAGNLHLKNRKMMKRFLSFMVVILLLGIFSVWSRIEVIETSYRIHQLTEVNRQLKSESDSLKLEISTLRSPQRLEKVAVEKLHLHKPLEKQVIFIK